ncbi:MAG TPA: hypothetical protein VK421_06720 [Pyrinomonadaceae bacterium]|nr:hypothetical protein [Pyrinomonadaceae bacterium]
MKERDSSTDEWADELDLEADGSDSDDAEDFGLTADDDGESDDDEYDDDDSAEVRTALLSKRDMLALLSVKTGEAGGLLVRIDPRQGAPAAQTYETADTALHWFRRSLSTSRRNGWDIIYDGPPLFG